MKKLYTIIILFSAFASMHAKESGERVSLSLGADFVSTYVWRGLYQTGFSVQPEIGLNFAGFSLSSWASTDIASIGVKEVDFTLGYSIAGLTAAITDYWCMGEGHKNYFHYRSKSTDHQFEGTLAYTLPFEKFPLNISCNTMFAGADYKENGDRAYSTYIELAYPFKVNDFAMDFSTGFTPHSGLYATKPSIVNVGIGAYTKLQFTDSYSLPIFGKVMANPSSEDIFFVFGFSL